MLLMLFRAPEFPIQFAGWVHCTAAALPLPMNRPALQEVLPTMDEFHRWLPCVFGGYLSQSQAAGADGRAAPNQKVTVTFTDATPVIISKRAPDQRYYWIQLGGSACGNVGGRGKTPTESTMVTIAATAHEKEFPGSGARESGAGGYYEEDGNTNPPKKTEEEDDPDAPPPTPEQIRLQWYVLGRLIPVFVNFYLSGVPTMCAVFTCHGGA